MAPSIPDHFPRGFEARRYAAPGRAAARAPRAATPPRPPSSVMKSRLPLSSMALPSGGRPSRSPAQVRTHLGRNAYPQKRHHEDQSRIKPDFHEVGSPIPPPHYRLLLYGDTI